ncbi:MAG: hypothetical protein ABL967_13500 [Bryobacteraceae bacterium]
MKCSQWILAPAVLPAALMLAPLLSAQSNVPAWQLADPDAKVLIGIDVRSIRNSAIGKSVSSQMAGKPSPVAAMPFRIPGMELLDDIDSVFVASTGAPASTNPPAAKPAPGSAKPAAANNPPFLLVVQGNFPMEHLQPLLSGKHPSYKAFNIYGSNGSNLAVMDEHTLVFGDPKSIRGAIDRKAAKPAALSSIYARAQELAAANDLWIVANGASFGEAQAANPFVKEIEGVEIALNVRNGLGLDLNLGTKTEATATMIAQLLSLQMQSALASQPSEPSLAEIAKKLQVGAQGKRMTVHLALTQAELEQSMQAVQAARMKTGARQTASAGATSVGTPVAAAETPRVNAAPAPPPGPPPGPRKVRIYGLDEGVREITIDPVR